jgi:hypothetical protein
MTTLSGGQDGERAGILVSKIWGVLDSDAMPCLWALPNENLTTWCPAFQSVLSNHVSICSVWQNGLCDHLTPVGGGLGKGPLLH